MSDFDACRFDFRFDAKNGLMPSKRKRIERCSQINYGTLFKCKVCSSLFPSRAQLFQHKLFHGEEHNCGICGRVFAKKGLLRDHVNNDHHLNERTNVEHTSVPGCLLSTDVLTRSPADVAVISSNARMTYNKYPPLLDIPDDANASYDLSSYSFLESYSNEESTSKRMEDDVKPPGYITNIARIFSSNSCEGTAASSYIQSCVEDSKLTENLSSLGSIPPYSVKSEKDPDEPEEAHNLLSQNGNISTSVIATYLTQLQVLQNNSSKYPEKSYLMNTSQETESYSVKQEPLETETFSNSLDAFRVNLSSTDVPECDQTWDTFKSDDSFLSNHTACESAIDLSLKGTLASNVCAKDELDALTDIDYFSNNNFSNLVMDKYEGNSEVCEMSDNIFHVQNICNDEKSLKTEEQNLDCYPDTRRAEYIRPTARKKSKTGLSKMVEKLWKNKLINSLKTSHTENENSMSRKTEDLPLPQDANCFEKEYLEFEAGTLLPASIPASSVFFKMQFRACPVCRQLFDNSKAMWDHAMSHPEYKKRHVMKRKNNYPESSSVVENQSQISGATCLSQNFSITNKSASRKLEMKTNVPMVNELSSETFGNFRCSFPNCDKVFMKEFYLTLHQKKHLSMQSIFCQLCPYSCQHQYLMKNHLSKNHSSKKMLEILSKSQSLNEPTQTCRLDEFLKSIVSKELRAMSKSPEVFPSEENVRTCEGSNNQEFTDKSDTTEIVEDLSCHSCSMNLDKSETKPEDVDDRSSVEGGEIWKVQSCFTDDTPSEKIEQRAVTPTMSNHVEKPQAKLLLRRVIPAPGSDPQFFTSLMKITYNKPAQEQGSTTDESLDTLRMMPTITEEFDKGICKGQPLELVDVPLSNSLQKFHCDACDVNLKSADDFESHLVSTHGHEVSELKNKTRFEHLSAHLSISTHRPKFQNRYSEDVAQNFVCPCGPCTSTHDTKSLLKSHVRNAHLAGETKLACLRDGCGRKFESESTLVNHLAMHSQERPLVCGYKGCDKTFRELKHLKVHQMQHTDLKPLRCGMCEYTCRQRNSMNWHMKSQHGLEKYVTPDGRTMYS